MVPEIIKITLDTKFRTSHYYQFVPVRQIVYEESPRAIYKIIIRYIFKDHIFLFPFILHLK